MSRLKYLEGSCYINTIIHISLQYMNRLEHFIEGARCILFVASLIQMYGQGVTKRSSSGAIMYASTGRLCQKTVH